jgi:hypothetical protein
MVMRMSSRRRPRRRADSTARQWGHRPPRALWVVVGVAGLAAANLLHGVIRKPTEVLGLVMPSLAKTPQATWSEYGPSFREYSTEIIRPELLAALVQVESAGDPLARTYWRWSWNPLALYAPASSAVGLLQMTDGTLEEASRWCIRDHVVVRAGPDAGPWFRAMPSHAIELTSARLHRVVEEMAAQRPTGSTSRNRQRLAAVVHLCGRERGMAFARRGYRVSQQERCGDHDLREYLARVQRLSLVFARLAARS